MAKVGLFRLVFFFLGAFSSMAYGGGQEEKSSARALPAAPEEWVVRLLEAGRDGRVSRHPEAFSAWLEAINEPRAMTALATLPQTDAPARTAGRHIDPAGIRNWDEFTDPGLYLRRLLAGLDARSYTAIYNCLATPERLALQVSALVREQSARAGREPDGRWLRLPESPQKAAAQGYAPTQRY